VKKQSILENQMSRHTTKPTIQFEPWAFCIAEPFNVALMPSTLTIAV